ncbi:hypothetical protein [Amycolatopsis anabasis]|uniref:hypothetical protein n=1 Tax=Amycolatopsis anabasis TaxID=1840409 RepID=UPI00131BC396|nr:hypothetical protein [Amycolatopsis anabasis]
MTTVDPPRILLDVPPGFTGLPLSADGQDNARRVADFAEKAARETGQKPGPVGEFLAGMVNGMLANNVRLFGKFAVGDEEPVLATLSMAIAPLSGDLAVLDGRRDALVESLLRLYREQHPRSDVKIVRLPIGPAVAAVVAGEYRLPGEVTGQLSESVRPVFRTEFQIPTPDGTQVILLSVSADSGDGWPLIAERSVTIARSVRVEQGARAT